jgi:hypothetical protein
MLVAAVLIRGRIDDDKQTVTSRSERTGPLTIVCVTELSAACDAIAAEHPDVETRVEEASTTAEALAKDRNGIDGWLTLDPWPDIANGLVTDPVFATSTSIASSPLVIAMVKEREVVLAPNCPGGVVGWRCLGDNVGRPWTDLTGGVKAWGNITVGNPPLTSATGLLLYGNAVTGYFGRTDIATNDFDDAFNAWRAKVKTTFMEADPFLMFVTQLPAKFAAVGVTLAEEQTNVGAQAEKVTVIDPTPQATAIVVLAPVGSGARAERVEQLARGERLGQTLQLQGWSVGQVPAQSGLPSPGVLLALSGLQR